MKIRNLFLHLAAVAVSLGAFSCSQGEAVADYRVIPMPQAVAVDSASAPFELSATTVIAYPEGNAVMKRNAELLADYLEQMTGNRLALTGDAPAKDVIVLSLGDGEGNPEGYTLSVTPERISIEGASEAGVFYGMQTLRKSIPEAGKARVVFPAVVVNDYPRFSYRGAHLDVSRHFFPTDSIKKYIDMLALHNINRFHWHLTDDQGWRLEIKKRPLLTEVGSKRNGTCVGHDFDSSDSIPYGGYYTQDEARDIVAYAADRHITVIPEIDMPGHMLGALTAYPELGCAGGPYEVWQRWGVSDDVLCAGNDSVLSFIDDVLSEVIEVFPSEDIHVGGDECPKMRWTECPKCQARIKAMGFKRDEHGTPEEKLQSFLIHHASDFLTSHGRKMIGWDETLEGGLAPGAVVMSWRGEDGAVAAARQGHDAIMTPTSYMYFDYYQTLDRTDEPDAIGGYVPVEKVYSFNPTPDVLTDEEKGHIIGVQANLWTEYIPTYSGVEYMELPRMAALSEVQWSEPGRKDYRDFTKRIPQLARHYDVNGYRYARHLFNVNGKLTPDAGRHAMMVEFSTVDDAPVRYTTDGSDPADGGMAYSGPFYVDSTCTVRAVAVRGDALSRVFTDSVTFNKATCRAIELGNEPHSRYRGDGAQTLVDGKYGSVSFTAGGWLGFEGKDLDAVIDLGEAVEVGSVAVRTLVQPGDWIFGPTEISVGLSDDGKTFRTVASEKYPVAGRNASEIVENRFDFTPEKTRWVKVVAKCLPAVPSWETRANGAPAFLFVDEIMID